MIPSPPRWPTFAVVLLLSSLAPGAEAIAQAESAGAEESSAATAASGASTRIRAGDAYDRGVRAFRARDFEAAARWFLTAYDVAPAPAALVQAIRAYTNARDVRRAGSLALAFENAAGLGPEATRTVQRAIGAASRRYFRVDVACTGPCELVAAGEAQRFPLFFVEAGRPVEIVASYPGGSQSVTVNGRAGGRQTVPVEVPAPPPTEAVEEPVEEDLVLDEGENPYRISRMRFLSRPRATFFVFSASSSVVYGITVWTGLDRGKRHDRLRDARATGNLEDIAVAQDRYDRSIRRERGYIGFSGVVTLTAGLVAAFTDWTPHGDEEDDDDGVEATGVQLDTDGAGAEVRVVGRF